MAENATHNLHNLLTLRGALVRDPRIWARYLTEAIELFAAKSDVLFASHHWPTWGRDGSSTLPGRAAGPVRLPARPDAAAAQPGLHRHRDRRDDRAAARAGRAPGTPAATTARSATTSRPIYQRYMGWFDGNPAHLWEHPPVESAQALRRLHGRHGRGRRARRGSTLDAGDLRFAAQLLNHAVFADPAHDGREVPARRGLRAAGPRRGERHLAQLLPQGAQELREAGRADT